MIRRMLRATVLASVLAAVSVGSVFAHECVIANRSERGNEAATNSQVWDRLYLADVLGFIHGAVGGDPLTESQIAWAVENRGDLPLFWVTNAKKTIGEGSSNPNLANGRGLDHLSQVVGEPVVTLYFAALAQAP